MNDKSFLSAIRKREDLNLLELCQDWIATYEIWLLDKSDTCAVRVDIPLGAHQVILPIQGYLDELYGWDVRLPLTISPDATRLFILGMLYLVRYDEQSGLSFHSCEIPSLAQIPADYSWKRDANRESPHLYSVQFCPRGRFLSLWQWHVTGRQSLTVLEIMSRKILQAVPVGFLEFNKHPYKIPDVCFHPTLALVAFYHFEPDGETANAASGRHIRIWQFRNRK